MFHAAPTYVVDEPQLKAARASAETFAWHMEQTNIRFATDEWYDHHRRKVVWFTAWADAKRVDCGVSIEALGDHFGAYHDDPLPTFRANRGRIEAVATKLILRGRFESDGTLVIRSADL